METVCIQDDEIVTKCLPRVYALLTDGVSKLNTEPKRFQSLRLKVVTGPFL